MTEEELAEARNYDKHTVIREQRSPMEAPPDLYDFAIRHRRALLGHVDELTAKVERLKESVNEKRRTGLYFQGRFEDTDNMRVEALERAEKAEKERDEAQRANERDRSLVAIALAGLDEAIGQRQWMLEGRGPYEWDDPKYRNEFHVAARSMRLAVEPLRSVAADLSNCPQWSADVRAAKADAASLAHAERERAREADRARYWREMAELQGLKVARLREAARAVVEAARAFYGDPGRMATNEHALHVSLASLASTLGTRDAGAESPAAALDGLLAEAGLHAYVKVPHANDPTMCIHAVPMGKRCSDCAALPGTGEGFDNENHQCGGPAEACAVPGCPECGAKATHRCKLCGALWHKRRNDEQREWVWSLRSEKAGPCCDNVVISDHVEPLSETGSGTEDKRPCERCGVSDHFLSLSVCDRCGGKICRACKEVVKDVVDGHSVAYCWQCLYQPPCDMACCEAPDDTNESGYPPAPFTCKRIRGHKGDHACKLCRSREAGGAANE